MEEQGRYTRAYLEQIPARTRIQQRVTELLTVETLESPRRAGKRYFFLKREGNQDQPCIYMRDDVEGPDELLIDPARRGTGPYTSVRIQCISRDGRFLAYEIRDGGEHTCAIEFFDVKNREVLPDRLPRGLARGLVFEPGNKKFYYAHDIINDPSSNYRVVRQHSFGTPHEEDNQIFLAGEDSKLKLVLSGDDVRLCFMVVRPGQTLTTDYYLWNLATQGPAKEIVHGALSPYSLIVQEGHVLAITDQGAPNLKITELVNPEGNEPCWRSPTPHLPLTNCGYNPPLRHHIIVFIPV